MKKQDTEESAPQDGENATPSTTEMQSSAAVTDSESPEASEPQIPETDAQSQSDEAVSEGKSPNFSNDIEVFVTVTREISGDLQYFGKSLKSSNIL